MEVDEEIEKNINRSRVGSSKRAEVGTGEQIESCENRKSLNLPHVHYQAVICSGIE